MSGVVSVELFVIGFGRPDLLYHQHRLIKKYLKDDFGMCLVDNSKDGDSPAMIAMCEKIGIGYMRSPSEKRLHPEALNFVSEHCRRRRHRFWGVLDHDIFPRRSVSLIDKIKKAGFYGIGQAHTPTQSHYIWPGFCFFSRKWLQGRVPNFDGIRGERKRDDGDCGSMLAPLFTEDDWKNLVRSEHGYGYIRPQDHYGLQSFGYEFIDGWIHMTNASHWMDVPEPQERDRLLLEMIGAL
jgi:hypothetical protein